SAVLSIRAKVDEVYRKLNQLCDILDGKSQDSHDPNPHGLMICESNELLTDSENLFADSNADEQVRLMTIAPKQWGRQKMDNTADLNTNVTKNFVHLSGFNQSQIRLDDRWFFEKEIEY
ncbi:unnamed protein product, partial [Didymodactylos carnosus]